MSRTDHSVFRLAMLLPLCLPSAVGCVTEGSEDEPPRVESGGSATPPEEGSPATGGADGPDTGPDLQVGPRSAAPGAEVRIQGAGFPSHARLALGFGPVQSEYEILDTLTAGPEGRIEAVRSLPVWAASGRPYVFVVATVDGGTRTVSAPVLAVEPGDTLTVEGRLTDEGVECPTLRSTLGVLYTLGGGDPSELESDAEVEVTATVPEMSFCMHGIPLNVVRLEPR